LLVKYVFVSRVQVSAAVFFKRPDVPDMAAIAVRSASNGWASVMPYPLSVVGVDDTLLHASPVIQAGFE